MRSLVHAAVLACGIGGACWAARCTTVAEPGALREYASYVAAAEERMPARFASGELAWVPGSALHEAEARLDAGKMVRWNISDAALNRRLAGRNGTVIHWIGAVRIRGATLQDLASVLEDYGRYDRIYRPMISQCLVTKSAREPNASYEVTLGLHNAFRFVSLFPQHYSFRVQARIDHFTSGLPQSLSVRLAAGEIRESDSGVPGRADFLEPYRDHGILWGLHSYWRARPRDGGLYFEFESITLARSVQSFACKIGFVPVPKSIVASVMDTLPGDSLSVIIEGTRAECERRAAGQ